MSGTRNCQEIEARIVTDLCEMQHIANDEDWLDVRLDDTALLYARLDNIGRSDILVSFADWSQLLIEADDPSDLRPLLNQQIKLVVTRTDDGLFVTNDAITDAIVEFGTL